MLAIHRSECINATDHDSSLLPIKKKVRVGCYHRLTEGDASYCILQSKRLLEAGPPMHSFVFHGSKEGLLMLCDQALLDVCPFRAENDNANGARSGHLAFCPHCKKRHFEGSTAKRLCEEWSMAKSVLKRMRKEMPEGKRYYDIGTTQLPYSNDTPDLVRRLISIRMKSAVLRRDRYICQDCHADFGRRRRKAFDASAQKGKGGYIWESLEVHHIIPRYKQGSDHPGNLKTLCPSCHRKYTSGMMVEFIEERKRERQTIRSIRELPDDRDEWDFRGE